MSKLNELLAQIAAYADGLPETAGKAGVFDRRSERYDLACLVASMMLGGGARGMKHPDADGEPLVQFLMPWPQDGVCGALMPLFRHKNRYYLLGGKRAAHLPRAGLFNWCGQGFKEMPAQGKPVPVNQGALTALGEWHDETGGVIPINEDELMPLGDVSLRSQYGGMFPGRDTCSLMYSGLFEVDNMDGVLAALEPTKEFDSFFFVDIERGIDTTQPPMEGLNWAFPDGDPVVALHVWEFHQKWGLPGLGLVDDRIVV